MELKSKVLPLADLCGPAPEIPVIINPSRADYIANALAALQARVVPFNIQTDVHRLLDLQEVWNERIQDRMRSPSQSRHIRSMKGGMSRAEFANFVFEPTNATFMIKYEVKEFIS